MSDVSDLTIIKSPTGIQGLDEIIEGGLPTGRTTLICGGPGCGKTLLATEFLVRGALDYNEPGVFMAFEETAEELATNVASLGFDLPSMIEQKKLLIDYVRIERSEIEETGEYDLEGLFIRLGSAIDGIGAKRVVLDTIETIFSGFQDDSILRAELRRLFRWMKNKGVTAIVTGEQGENSLTRYGLEEYVSDCVMLLENRMENKISNRILRVIKYRGSAHGTDEYPFLIGDGGIWVQPITSLGLDYPVSKERISTGVEGLDEMLGGQGYYRGSSILISGAAGTGKTSLAAALVDSACRRGERCLYFAFEESTNQIMRNMRSINIDLQQWVDQGLLRFRAVRPTFYGIEMHLLTIQKLVEEFQPSVVAIDPLTNLISVGSPIEVRSMLTRLIDYLKIKNVTSLFNSLTSGVENEVSTEVGISSLMDTWVLVRNIESNAERNRGLFVLKARGMAHSSQVREFRLTDLGIELVDVLIGPEGNMLTGSARIMELNRARAEEDQRQTEIERRQRELANKRRNVEEQIAALQSVIAEEEEELARVLSREQKTQQEVEEGRRQLSHTRMNVHKTDSGNGKSENPQET